MEICIECLDGEKYTVEVGVDDTITDIRRKAAAAAALCEDGFDMRFGGKVMAEGDFTTQLSAGDTVVLTKKTMSQKEHAIAALRDLGWETRLTAESLVSLTDPKLVHLFLQAEVVTEIPNAFLSGGTFRELDLSGVSVVTKVGADFLSYCEELTTIDISGWSNVTRIGNRFLKGSGVRTLDISGWNKVTEIEYSFLRDGCMLDSLDLSGWNNVTRIGTCFLYNCCRLTTLDISGWNKVTVIKSHFLYDCNSLTTLDISGWSNVTYIEQHFLANCSSLSMLNFSGWSSVTWIETGFLAGCKKIRVNIAGSSSVVSNTVRQSRYKDTKHEAKDTCQCVCM